MSHYTRGAAFERKVKKYYEELGWFSVRAAGSHGVADIVSVTKLLGKTLVNFVSCRSNGKWTKQELQELRYAARCHGANPLTARPLKNGKIELLAINLSDR